MIKIDIESLEREKIAILAFYKKQIEAYRILRQECEKVQWSDQNYDRFVESMNIIGNNLSKIIQSLSDGRDVYMISELLDLVNKYTECAKAFPKI